MNLLEWLRPPRAVLTLFMGLMAVCALALGWLGRQVLVQDRAVEAQRRQEQIEGAADRALAAIHRAYSAYDVEVTADANGEVRITPSGRLAYTPERTPPGMAVPPETFAAAEAFEFSKQDRAKAAEAYARIAASGSTAVLAEALVRLGRVLRREKKW